METKAVARSIRMSPRKVRRVIDQIRGKTAYQAMTILEFMPYAAAKPVRKLLNAAMFNLINSEQTAISEEEAFALRVVEAHADEGRVVKRFCPRARGRAYPIKKRSSHITIVLSDI